MVVIRLVFAVMHCVATATLEPSLVMLSSGVYLQDDSLSWDLPRHVYTLHMELFHHFEKTELIGLFHDSYYFNFILVFSISVKNEKKIIYRELREEAENGLIPMAHLEILDSPVE